MLNSIKRDINSYRYYITNKNSGIKKKNINSISTYKAILKPKLNDFLKYVENQLNKKPKSLLKCFVYLPQYTDHIIRKYKSKYIKVKIQFIYSLSIYIKDKQCRNSKERKSIDEITAICKNRVNNVSFYDTIQRKNKEYRQQIPYKKIIYMIEHMEENTERKIRDKLIISLLAHTSWRANNILELKLGETIFKSNGKWWYNFPTCLQKSKKAKTSVIGEFPASLQRLISLYIERTGIKNGEYLFRTKKLTKWNTSYLTNLVIRITEKNIGIKLNPHVFRNIIFTYLLEKGCPLIHAQLVLWHKPSISSSDAHYFVTNTSKILLQVNEKYIEPLYNTEKPLPQGNKITIENINPAMMQEIMNVISKYNSQNENIV